MNPYQPGEDNQDPYMVGYKAGAASRDAEVADWRSQAHRSQSEADRLEQERAELLGAQELNRNAIRLAKQREAKLHEQVKMLRDEVIRCRDWFETQAKVTSKGGPSSWELMLLRDERDAADEVLSATEPKE